MTRMRMLPAFDAVKVVFVIALCATVAGCFGDDGPAKSPVACADLTTLRELAPALSQYTNPRTGNTVSYLVLGDAAVSDKLIVMFNGTGAIIPDWPVQMITNSRHSPDIVKSEAYVPAEDGAISLCHDYRLVMFDYPGVGSNPLIGNVTYDAIANDVDAMLDDVAQRYGIPTHRVEPLGWSLGAIAALKYAFVSPRSNPNRTIGNLVLIAAKPGGNTDGFFDGNEADCVMTLFNELKNNPSLDPRFKAELDADLFKLTFPFVGQPPYTGPSSGCNATIVNNDSVQLNVMLDCPLASECNRNLILEGVNRKTSPWSITSGVDYKLFVQQRELATDYSLCYCAAPGPNFTSTGCACSGIAPQMSPANGGVCKTVSPQPNTPVSTNCVPLDIRGKINVINGPEDLLIQYIYGQELVAAYQRMYGPQVATIATYPGSDGAGHGVHLQHPKWAQEQIQRSVNE